MPELAIELAPPGDSLIQWFSLVIDYVESPDFLSDGYMHEAVHISPILRIRGRASRIVTQICKYFRIL